jgi:hypothetical protein
MAAMPARRSTRRGVSWEHLRDFALALPGVEARTSFGTPALYVKKKFMARLRDDDPDVLVLKPIDDVQQQFLMDTQPDVFFTTDHYRGYPTILVRLSSVHRAEVEALVHQCWRALAPPKLVAHHDGALH